MVSFSLRRKMSRALSIDPSGASMAESMDWLLLLIAGLFEVGWAIGLKYTDGFTKLWPSVWTVLAMVLSFVFLAQRCERSRSGRATRSGRASAPSGRSPLGSHSFPSQPRH